MTYIQIFALAMTIFATTADDLLWLVPYTLKAKSKWVRIAHAALFVITLQIICLSCGFIAYSTIAVVVNEVFISWVGAGFAWTIAVSLFIRKQVKMSKHKRMIAEEDCRDAEYTSAKSYGTVLHCGDNIDLDEKEDNESVGFSPGQIISLTFIGALDEVSYFPAILLSKSFTIFQLNMAALVACLSILLIIQFWLPIFMPLLSWIDNHIPLFAIVGLYAVILTFEALLQWILS